MAREFPPDGWCELMTELDAVDLIVSLLLSYKSITRVQIDSLKKTLNLVFGLKGNFTALNNEEVLDEIKLGICFYYNMLKKDPSIFRLTIEEETMISLLSAEISLSDLTGESITLLVNLLEIYFGENVIEENLLTSSSPKDLEGMLGRSLAKVIIRPLDYYGFKQEGKIYVYKGSWGTGQDNLV